MPMDRLIADRGTGEPISLGAALLAGKKVAPDVTGLLMEDHRTVLGWFDWYAAESSPAQKSVILEAILKALVAHMAAEEEVFYPEAARCTGDRALIDHALREHEHARSIMAHLQVEIDSPNDTLVAQLRDEIATHVQEEESELFPRVRTAHMDLYGVGALVAARRVDSLFKSNPTSNPKAPQHGAELTEMPPMPIDKDDATEVFRTGLRNIHGTANQCLTLVDTQLNRLENYPQLRARLESHRQEKKAQLDRVERILQSLGDSPSTFKDLAGAASALMAGATSAMADDEVLKSSFGAYGLANFEAAAYETLLLLAEASGHPEALPPLQQSLSEERAMACFIAENLRATGLRYLELRSEGGQASH
jgi:ferritin-like metal-binding protein YciE/iron-sulfur cluster repair protein YtfE (RIC family)